MAERLLLALDTATADVTAAVVRQDGDLVEALATETTVGAQQHAERLAPNVEAALGRARVLPRMLDGVVVGLGPGPFTGLRVGVASAAALADALGVPAYGVCSLDAVDRGSDDDVLVATDARRREVYWAAYRAGRRTDGPAVGAPADVALLLADRRFARLVLAGAERYTEVLGPLAAEVGEGAPTGGGLVRAALTAGVLDREAVPLRPLYLRRPDAVEPGGGRRSTVQFSAGRR